MCILFLYVAKHSAHTVRKNAFKVILAANRDEFYSRPSRAATFWESDTDILGGQDLQSGGTWLGMNVKSGKIAALLNIAGGSVTNKDVISRGSLITNFLRSGPGLNGWTYCKNLYHDPSFDILNDFKQFNLLAIDVLDDSKTATSGHHENKIGHNANDNVRPVVTYFTNHPSNKLQPVNCQSEFTALGNSVLDKPFQKVCAGKSIFEEIISSSNYSSDSSEDKAELKSKLLGFLKFRHRFLPDSELESTGRNVDAASSIYLHIPEADYGTRTHTVILVDNENKIDFHEWTKECPIAQEEGEQIWRESNYTFNLGVCTVSSKL